MRSQKRAGLGLSICKSHVELLNVELCIESELGAGTKAPFKLLIEVGVEPKLISVEEYSEAETGDELRPPKNTRILVAENDPTSAMLAPCGRSGAGMETSFDLDGYSYADHGWQGGCTTNQILIVRGTLVHTPRHYRIDC